MDYVVVGVVVIMALVVVGFLGGVVWGFVKEKKRQACEKKRRARFLFDPVRYELFLGVVEWEASVEESTLKPEDIN